MRKLRAYPMGDERVNCVIVTVNSKGELLRAPTEFSHRLGGWGGGGGRGPVGGRPLEKKLGGGQKELGILFLTNLVGAL